ncbi:MAG: hypothetical protein HZA79_00555 [Sphingobacteriales bacterium]|nr:hypothetical protein [Sphingobacteriales bacterium]
MIIGVIANKVQKEEWLSLGIKGDARIEWPDHPGALPGATAIIDLLFTPADYPETLRNQTGTLFFINQVSGTRAGWPAHFIRFNGWPGFLQSPLLEAACPDESVKKKAEEVIGIFTKTIEWVPDIPGFLSARVLASVINEAYFALEEEVSSKPAIDTAMKLGTNYPYGPFEWCDKIGQAAVFHLLSQLAEISTRYRPSVLLQKEASV